MAMDKINGSPYVQPGTLDKFQGPNRSGKKDDTSSGTEVGREAAPSNPPADTVEISDTAHRLMDLRQAVDTGRLALSGLPDVREEKVALARQRLESGYYASDEVRQDVAAKVQGVFKRMDDL